MESTLVVNSNVLFLSCLSVAILRHMTSSFLLPIFDCIISMNLMSNYFFYGYHVLENFNEEFIYIILLELIETSVHTTSDLLR